VDSRKVDGERLCITGGSAGGYTTLAALAFKDTFKAGASLYGVSSSFTLIIRRQFIFLKMSVRGVSNLSSTPIIFGCSVHFICFYFFSANICFHFSVTNKDKNEMNNFFPLL